MPSRHWVLVPAGNDVLDAKGMQVGLRRTSARAPSSGGEIWSQRARPPRVRLLCARGGLLDELTPTSSVRMCLLLMTGRVSP